jgi:hypothetical protein
MRIAANVVIVEILLFIKRLVKYLITGRCIFIDLYLQIEEFDRRIEELKIEENQNCNERVHLIQSREQITALKDKKRISAVLEIDNQISKLNNKIHHLRESRYAL